MSFADPATGTSDAVTDLMSALFGKQLEEMLAIRPASASELAPLIEAANQEKLKFGDIVVLREWARGMNKFPKLDQRCIVTQVLATPVRRPYDATIKAAETLDIALGFSARGSILGEYLYDSRQFRKVGSIYDGQDRGAEASQQ